MICFKLPFDYIQDSIVTHSTVSEVRVIGNLGSTDNSIQTCFSYPQFKFYLSESTLNSLGDWVPEANAPNHRAFINTFQISLLSPKPYVISTT